MAFLRPRTTSDSAIRRRAALAAVAIAALATTGVAAAPASIEYAVKANYLYKFGPFVEWPPRTFAASGPFNVCLIGEDPFGRTLDDAVRGQTVAGRPVAVRRLHALNGVTGCQVLYIGRLKSLSPADVLAAVRGSPVLTVTDEAAGIGGGMVHFMLKNGRVRFALNPSRAEASGLVLSSKLQALATPYAGPVS